MFDEKELRLAKGVFIRNGANRVNPDQPVQQQVEDIPVNHQNFDRIAYVSQDQTWTQD